tara:strand:+ start:1056 stop:1523 length:468 start_codon:yes stop_codon:yes gene_type:complete
MFYFFVLIITLCYFFLSLIYLLYTFNTKYYKKKYLNSVNISKDTSKKCIAGCKSGICHRGISCRDYFPYNEKCCNFNFECKECTDIYDNHIYKLDVNKDVYETPEEIKELNQTIVDKNQQIRKKNDSIKKMNESISLTANDGDNINITPDNITQT